MASAHEPVMTAAGVSDAGPPADGPAATITVRFFAGAAEAAGTEELVLEAATGRPVHASGMLPADSPDSGASEEIPGEPLEELLLRLPGTLVTSGVAVDDAGLTRVFRACSFLLNGQRVRRDAAVVEAGDQLDVLPPFAGG